MRTAFVLLLGLCTAAAPPGDDKAAGARYGVAPDPATFPQKTPQQALASVLKAVEARRVDYLAAQLADPDWVDERVKRLYDGDFAQQVEETRIKLDAPAVKLLGRFLKVGDWSLDGDRATARLKDVPDRVVRLRRLGDRWYVEHRNKPG
jgi:hypothetical protein